MQDKYEIIKLSFHISKLTVGGIAPILARENVKKKCPYLTNSGVLTYNFEYVLLVIAFRKMCVSFQEPNSFLHIKLY